MKSLLAIALSLFATSAMAAPALRGEVTVTAAIVTVGDMFDNSGALAETALFKAPAPGTTGIVPLDAVRRAATSVGLENFDNVGFTRVRVARASSLVDAPLLSGLIAADMKRRGLLTEGMTAETIFDRTSLAISAEAVDQPATLLDLRTAPDGGFFARFLIAGIDEPLALSGHVQLMIAAPHLVASRAAGEILSRDDFELGMVPVRTADAGHYASLDQLVGKQLTRQSRAGMVLKAADVAEPTVVVRNASVTVILRAGAMTLTVKGKALGSAAVGEPVDVLNTVTKKILHGIALKSGAVEIVTATLASL